MDVKRIFGSNLRKFRKEAGLSQEELAEKAGVSAKHIGSLETGISFASAELLENFSQILKTPVAQFFDDGTSHTVGDIPLNTINNIINMALSQAGNIMRQEVKRKMMAYRK